MLGLAERVREIQSHARSLARLQLELAMLEVKRKAKALGIAAALGIVALVVVLYAIGFIFAAMATGLTEVVPLWAALLIVSFLLLLTALVLLLVAVRTAKKAGPARPVETVEEAQTTVRELRDV
jgi:protein-S-isoprenylcysteine O-methyltransferase Ste14